jgi:hypothetical protein
MIVRREPYTRQQQQVYQCVSGGVLRPAMGSNYPKTRLSRCGCLLAGRLGRFPGLTWSRAWRHRGQGPTLFAMEYFSEYHLSTGERKALSHLAALVSSGGNVAGQQPLIAATNNIGASAPALERLRAFAADLLLPSSPGVGLVRGLPRDDDPTCLGAIVGATLGPIVKYPGEGDWIIAIKEDAARQDARPSFANAREFFLHTDLSYAPTPPEYFAMQSVINNPGEGGISVFCDSASVLDALDSADIDELHKPQFIFPAPPHYEGVSSVTLPILTPRSGWTRSRVRFRRDNLRSETRPGISAVIALIQAMSRSTFEILLDSGTVALIDNHRILHGRTAFVGSADSAIKRPPRHLKRMYIQPAAAVA